MRVQSPHHISHPSPPQEILYGDRQFNDSKCHNLDDDTDYSDDEKLEAYLDCATKFEGFYMDDDYRDIDIMGGIDPCTNLDNPSFVEMAKFAVKKNNEIEGNNLQFSSIIRVNAQLVSGLMYYITLKAVDDKGEELPYEAKVWEGITETSLQLFRVAKYM